MKRFKDILCVLEPAKTCKPALERAVTLAENNQASLTVVGLVERVTAGIGMPDGGPISARLQDALVQAREQELEPLVAPYRKRADIRTKVLKGVPFLEVVREVLRGGQDLLVKTPEDPDWFDRVFGSNDMHLLRKCPCPVWLIKSSAPQTYRCVLAAVDVDEAYPPAEIGARRVLNRHILEMASSLALSEFAELHVVHVWDAVGESAMRGAFLRTPEEEVDAYVQQVRRHHERALKDLMQEVTGKLGKEAAGYLKPRTHLVKGWARKEIPALAREIGAELVVMGTVARTGIPGFIMGNTAETILSQLDSSVLAIKPPGFATPVTLEG